MGGEGCGVAAVHPALLEVPEWGDDQVVPPGWGKPVLGPAWLQLDLVTDQLEQNYPIERHFLPTNKP